MMCSRQCSRAHPCVDNESSHPRTPIVAPTRESWSKRSAVNPAVVAFPRPYSRYARARFEPTVRGND